ncbi:MAG TPA: RNA polymerase sigma-70 factor [Ohtaekwangia sp.]|nr:RNA polymerase sigma-70 factor [Ohtaekwangia sp.]
MKDIVPSEIIKQLKASDPCAFETVFNLYQDAIYHFLLFKTRDQPLAEDLLQDVFCKLWSVRTTLNEEQSLRNYLYTMADNLVLNHFRHLKVVSRHHREADKTIFSQGDSPHFKLEEKEWHDTLVQAIESLPEKPRIVFLMSRLDDLTYQEIADRLSLSIKTVESHMVKALKILRETITVKV